VRGGRKKKKTKYFLASPKGKRPSSNFFPFLFSKRGGKKEKRGLVSPWLESCGKKHSRKDCEGGGSCGPLKNGFGGFPQSTEKKRKKKRRKFTISGQEKESILLTKGSLVSRTGRSSSPSSCQVGSFCGERALHQVAFFCRLYPSGSLPFNGKGGEKKKELLRRGNLDLNWGKKERRVPVCTEKEEKARITFI